MPLAVLHFVAVHFQGSPDCLLSVLLNLEFSVLHRWCFLLSLSQKQRRLPTRFSERCFDILGDKRMGLCLFPKGYDESIGAQPEPSSFQRHLLAKVL